MNRHLDEFRREARRADMLRTTDCIRADLAVAAATLDSLARLQARQASAQVLTIALRGEIGQGRAVTALDLDRALRRDPHRPVALQINSPGGSVQEALRMLDAVRRHKGAVTSNAAGRCDSAAILPLAAGQLRNARHGARLVLHDPAFDGAPSGRLDARRLRMMADLADDARDQIAAALARTTDAPADWWAARMAEGKPVGPWKLAAAGLLTHIDGRAFALRPWRDMNRGASAC